MTGSATTTLPQRDYFIWRSTTDIAISQWIASSFEKRAAPLPSDGQRPGRAMIGRGKSEHG